MNAIEFVAQCPDSAGKIKKGTGVKNKDRYVGKCFWGKGRGFLATGPSFPSEPVLKYVPLPDIIYVLLI